jgi:ABC-2 type transport system ATP-binding protein
MIEFINITKKFRHNFWEKNFYALNDVSFSIKENAMVGFLGANGAGKTTLIKCLMDFSRQDSGEIKFGKQLGKDTNEIKSNIGYLPERAYLYQHLTGREFLNYSAKLNRLSAEKAQTLISSWAERMSITYALDRNIKGYSKGMQQRLGFISTILHSPKFLVLDEPLSGLDPIGRRDFKKILKELNEEGTTIFFSSHIVADVEEICNDVVFIEKGNLIYNGKIKSLLEQNTTENFQINYYGKDGNLVTEKCLASEKEQRLLSLIQQGCQIANLEKDKINLEEIIYKIKK